MKVLVVLTGEMCFDGITNSIYNYYYAMDLSDMQIDIVSARKTNPEMRSNFENIGCRVFTLENRDKHTICYIRMLINIIRKGKYDIVHAHGNSATLAIEMLAAKIAGCKVRIIHSRNSSCEHKNLDKILRPLMYATYTHGFACGQKAGEWLFEDRPFTILNNGKNIEKFLFRNDIRKKYRMLLGATDEEILLGHVGLFHKQKNHDFLIEVFAQVCERSDRYKLVLIGEGEEKKRIQNKVSALKLSERVYFLGQKNDVQNWLQALDIMLFPSLFEGMPNVVLEWQIAGLPSLISDHITRECGITDLVRYLPIENGPAEWADDILKIYIQERDGCQSTIRKAFIEAGFDINENAKTLKNEYRRLVAGGK